MRTTKFALILLMSCLSAPLLADTTAEQIRQATQEFLDGFATEQAAEGYTVSFEPGSIDDRLALAECEKPLSVEFSGDPWKSTSPSMQVACEGSRPWRMFVTASVSIHGPALVAARPLTRGERVTEGLLAKQSVEINASRRGVITDAKQAIGMEVRRSVNAGSLITPDMLSAPMPWNGATMLSSPPKRADSQCVRAGRPLPAQGLANRFWLRICDPPALSRPALLRQVMSKSRCKPGSA